MCGIAGFLDLNTGELDQILHKMGKAIAHRGPDDSGVWADRESGVGLSHRRLSVVDLSPAGHQPMLSSSNRFVIAFNGEIYNHLQLRSELVDSNLAPAWRGYSDTETLLAGFEAWGIEDTIKKSVGMFAVALWDRQLRMLTLVRDRMGEKPLYYGWQGSGTGRVFLFASELKAIRVHPAFSAEIDRNVLCLLLRYSYVPAPWSIYRGISKLEPGCLLTVSFDRPELKISKYWDTFGVACRGVHHPFSGTADEAVDVLDRLAKDAIRQQMVADVPLGAFLSGGIDSTTVVAMMQAQSTQPIKTFTIGFGEGSYDEAVHAKAVAEYLGTEHRELYVTPQQAMDLIPLLPTLYCEPFSDVSQIPTCLVSRLARQHVTVSLSGDGGDELFCGYNRYVLTSRLWRRLSRLPLWLRRIAAHGLTSFSPMQWNALLAPAQNFLPGPLQQTNIGDKLHKGAGVLASNSVDSLYTSLVSHWDDLESVVIAAKEPPSLLSDNSHLLSDLDEIQRMMALDTVTYLADDILTKVDRAAMGVSLESRVPFLDHRIVEFAWSLPLEYKLRGGVSKWALRQVLYKYVPKELIQRPKMGFSVPIDAWLRGPLRDWAESLLNESRLRSEGYFNPLLIRQKWAEHLSGKRNWQYHLWDVLMFQAWFEESN